MKTEKLAGVVRHVLTYIAGATTPINDASGSGTNIIANNVTT